MNAPAIHPRVPRIGELLVAQGLLSQCEVDAILDRQREVGRPFGVLCEEMFGIDPEFVEGAWVDQYRVLSASFDADFVHSHPAALALVNARQAWQFRIVPLRLEHGTLVAATTPAHLARASRFATMALGIPALFVVVDSNELAGALEAQYPIDGMDVQTVRKVHARNGNSRT
ncbi:MAG: hypothetical protein EXS17_00510 [Phycisphaerales bacterium]|nr:hypothetical protein [Phycisphaerales bacterium]